MISVKMCCCLSLGSGTLIIAMMDLVFGIVGLFVNIDQSGKSEIVINVLTIIAAVFLIIGAHEASISLNLLLSL